MKNGIRAILFLCIGILMILHVAVGWADDIYDQSSAMEGMLMVRVNEARVNPLKTAAAFGKDPQALLAALPDLTEALSNGLIPLRIHAGLSAAAQGHTRDMLANNYYSKISLDGRNDKDRIDAAGFPTLASGEAMGVVAFKNFIEPQKAVDILFKNMFLDELQSDAAGARKLLNPRFTHIGIGIQTGSLTFGNTSYNVYLATLDFGVPNASPVSSIQDAETTLVHLINQARTKPLEVAAAMGLDPETILSERPDWAVDLQHGLGALTPNEILGQVARMHTEEMVAYRYFDPDGYDGQSTQERLQLLGVETVEFEQVIDILALEPETSLADVSTRFFAMLMTKAFTAGGEEAQLLFDPALTEVGIGLRAAVPQEGEGFNHLYLVTFVFATPVAASQPRLMGVAYVDGNGNNLFDPGEGIPSLPLYVDYPNVKLDTAMDAIGGMDLPIDPGGTRVVIWPGGGNAEYWADSGAGAGSQWIACKIE